MKAMALLLVSGCSVVFAPGDRPEVEGPTVDGGEDAGQDATGADGGVCDPFSGGNCYINNDPLGGPLRLSPGADILCDECELSNDCAPGLFCSGFIDAPGRCYPLCDESHDCVQGACLGVQLETYGFCAGIC